MTFQMEDTSQMSKKLGPRDRAFRACNAPPSLDPTSDNYHPPMMMSTEHRGNYVKLKPAPRYKRMKPVYTGPGAKLDDKSMYQEQFNEKHIVKTRPIRHEDTAFKSDKPIETNTTHHDDYTVKKIQLAQNYKPKYVPNIGPAFENLTCSRLNYDHKPLSMRSSIRRPDRLAPKGSFQSTTENKDNFNQKFVLPERAKGKDKFVPSKEPLSSETNYRNAYVHTRADIPKNFRPMKSSLASSMPMQTDTDYRLNYLTPKYTKTKVARMPSEIKRSSAPMEQTSNYRDAYVGKYGEKAKSSKPPPTVYDSNRPLENSTMSRRCYVKHSDALPAVSMMPRCTLRTLGEFAPSTSYRDEYTGREAQRARPRAAGPRIKPGKFSAATSYRDNYADHGMAKPKVVGAGYVYRAPSKPFTGSSDYRDNYFERSAKVDTEIKVPCDNKRLLY